jgi:hypothetical protein
LKWAKIFGQDPKSTGKKSKNKKMGLYQIKKLLSKENNQRSEEMTWRMGKNICKPYIWKGLYPEYIRNYKNSILQNSP